MDVELIGQTVDGRYRVERCIGTGGMGTVWRAQHTQTLQHYALKTLRVSKDLPKSAIQRCLKEARAAAALRSRYVVRVIDVQPQYVHQGTALPYLVMELLEGIDFESVLMQRKALSVAEVAWVMLQVCRGLQLAHDQGIVHRDLKPANLFLATDDDGAPVVKICDFGLAKSLAETSDISMGSSSTQTGMVAGTPRYMAPEQLRDGTRATPTLDQWAIGLIAYRLLTGEDYFSGATSAIALTLQIVHDEMPRPSDHSERVHREFDTWFFRSCARDPTLRFASVQEQSQALVATLGVTEPLALDPIAVPCLRRTDDETQLGPNSPAVLEDSSRTRSGNRRTYLGLGITAALSVFGTVGAAMWLHSARIHPTNSSSVATATPGAASLEPLALAAPSLLSSAVASSPVSQAPVPERRRTPSKSPVVVVASSGRDERAASSVELASTSTVPVQLAAGAACTRSAQCASQLCVAERCR